MNDLLLLDTHSVNTKNIAWESIMQPRVRHHHAKATLQWLLIINVNFGGFGESTSFNDLHAFDLQARGWENQPRWQCSRGKRWQLCNQYS